MSNTNRAVKFWDRLAKTYDGGDGQLDPTERTTLEKAKRYLKAGDTVLDYGCATGTMAFEIAPDVRQVQGIDISSKMIAAAQRKAGQRPSANVDFAQASIFDDTFAPASFDVILALNILHLLEDTPAVMRRINDLLKPGGFIISVTACLGERRTLKSILLSIPIFLAKTIGMFPYIRFFKIAELENEITQGHFQIVETQILTHDPATAHFVVARKESDSKANWEENL